MNTTPRPDDTRTCGDCAAPVAEYVGGCWCCPAYECGTRYACPDCGPLNGHRYRSARCKERALFRGNGTKPPSGIMDVVREQPPAPFLQPALAFSVVASHEEDGVTVIDSIEPRAATFHVGGGVHHVIDYDDGGPTCPFCRELTYCCRCGR